MPKSKEFQKISEKAYISIVLLSFYWQISAESTNIRKFHLRQLPLFVDLASYQRGSSSLNTK